MNRAVRTPSSLRQLRTLVGLWWRHVRRRPMRVGEAPKVSGTPAFLLIGAFTTGYMTLITWQSVAQNVKTDPASFGWHAFGVLLLGFAIGLSKGGGRLQVRGTRNDAFLEALPLRTLARLGLQLADAVGLLPLTAVGVFAAHSVQDGVGFGSIPGALLGSLGFVCCFVLGHATVAWARALGPATIGRWIGYAGVALSLIAMVGLVIPLGKLWITGTHSLPARLARAWIGPDPALPQLYAATIAVGLFGARGLIAAERRGFDQLDPQLRTPKQRRYRDRLALERVMMLRHGGAALLFLYTVLGLAALSLFGALYASIITPPRKLLSQGLMFVTGFVIYLGAIQTIGQAGRAARADQQARSFLAALPISPHQVLEGKTRALRLLVIPVLVILALLAAASSIGTDGTYTYRIVLSSIGLYVIVEGAVSIAFLSTGIGVIGLGGGAQTTGFSTQILLLPLFATVLAPNNWAATTAFIAVAAVTFESRRAARLNVRWLDDPAEDLDRETTVWRALLAAAAFFAVQGLSFQILSLFDLPQGYALALAFASSSVLLALLTWRNDARIERPRFLPRVAWAWPAGVLAGATSGLLARELAKYVPAPSDVSMPEFSSGELVALAIMTTVIAPLVEEYFFRGWLQRAVAADLPVDKKKWAFALGAAAFALAHFGTYGVPQLVLGLFAGWLFARSGGLWPSILAHAAHNGVVLLLEL